MYQSWTKLGKIPGRPASLRPAGLSPPHTVAYLRSRGNVTHSNASESWIGCRFDQTDRKALAWIQGPTSQLKFKCKSVIHLPGQITRVECNVGAAEARDVPERGRAASLRPAGLAHARVEVKQLHTDKCVGLFLWMVYVLWT